MGTSEIFEGLQITDNLSESDNHLMKYLWSVDISRKENTFPYLYSLFT